MISLASLAYHARKQQNIPYYAVFNIIRTEIGQDRVNTKQRKESKISHEI